MIVTDSTKRREIALFLRRMKRNDQQEAAATAVVQATEQRRLNWSGPRILTTVYPTLVPMWMEDGRRSNAFRKRACSFAMFW